VYAKNQMNGQSIPFTENPNTQQMWDALAAISHTGSVGIPVIKCCNEVFVQPGGHSGISMADFLVKAETCANSQPGPPPPPAPAVPVSVQGPCVLDDDGCVTSPNFPANYGNNERCTIGPNFGVISVSEFNTERNWDKLFVDGTAFHGRYTGSNGPLHGAEAVGDITWNSDGSVVKKGWKICREAPPPPPTPGPPTPAPTPPPGYADLGVGKCLSAAGQDPAHEWHSGQSSTCESLCNARPTCGGYSASPWHCLLWMEPGLIGGGANWGGAHCKALQSPPPPPPPPPAPQPCTGPDCNIPGGPCTGPDCNIPGGPCTGPDCNIPGGPCTGPDCQHSRWTMHWAGLQHSRWTMHWAGLQHSRRTMHWARL